MLAAKVEENEKAPNVATENLSLITKKVRD